MTDRPLLSVCIPTYNRAGYLHECLSSIETRGLDNLVEVVVSDNASTDDTLDVLKEFANRLPLRWVVQAEFRCSRPCSERRVLLVARER
jgi:glycosyltransferase involved in cell wall biosynthesis